MYNKNFIITDIDNVILVDKNEYPEEITSFPATLGTNELIYNFSGYHTIYFNNNKLNSRPDMIRFLPKGEHSRYDVERISSGDCIVVFFQTNTPLASDAFLFDTKNKTHIRELFKKTFSIWVAKNEGYRFECISLLYKIFAEMEKSKYISENQFMKIKPAVDYIHENFLTEKISSEYLAAICGISYSYLKQLFLKKYNVSPTQYIIQLKMNYACDMLKTNLYNVSQIADACGFCDIYFFSSQFKKHLGITPREFQNKYKSSK